MKFVTFNIRRDNHKDRHNNFDFRKEYIIDKIEKEKPDIIAFQEVLPHVMDFLKENLKGYCIIGRGRGKDFKEEACPIAVREEAMEIVEFSTFWLSPTPAVPGSRFYDQSIFPRICSQAIIHDREKDFYFRVYNTHLDHIGENARFLGMRCLLNRMKADCECFKMPAILCGDFNENPSSKVLEEVRNNSTPRLLDVTEGIDHTYHDYYYGRKEPCKIDYILVSREFKPSKLSLWQDNFEGVYLSDHYPVESVLLY